MQNEVEVPAPGVDPAKLAGLLVIGALGVLILLRITFAEIKIGL